MAVTATGPAGPPGTQIDAERRWNLVDPLVGFIVAQILSALVAALVIDAEAGAGAGVGLGLAAAFDGSRRSLMTGLGLLGIALVQVPLWATEVGTVLFAGEVRGRGVRRDFGLALRPWDVPLGLVLGVVTQGVVSGGYALVSRLVGGLDADRTAQAISAKGTGAAVVAVFLLFAVVAPFVEELFFRGLLQRAIGLHLPVVATVVLTALLFAAIHFELLLLPGLFVAGLVFGVLAQRSGRLGPSIFAHIGFNASTIIALALAR